MIDELSLGVTLLHSQARFATELAHFIHFFENGTERLHPLRHLVWSKLSYVLGFVHPTSTPFGADTELALQKAFFDHMWAIPLAAITAFRWDKPRRFKGNDLYDFNHASAALAYCRAFFTERPLQTLITSKNIALDKIFNCQVVSDVSEATAFLKTLTLREASRRAD